MNKAWKIAVTVGVAVLFILAFTGIIYVIGQGIDTTGFMGDKVMVIPVHGAISFSGCGGSVLSGRLQCAQMPVIKKQLEKAASDPSIGAVLLEVNSGGGSVVASRELMREVRDFEKPIVAWIGESGTSGAYYIASAADHVVADRNSLTGSIGVIMQIPHYHEFMDEWGFNMTIIKAGDSKDIGSPYRPMKEEEKGELKDIADKIYLDFISDVAENRNLSESYVRNLSKGQIYLGREAENLGLIDSTGGKKQALDKAAELAGIEGKPEVKEEERKVGLVDVLFRGSS